MILDMGPLSHFPPPKQHSMIRFVRIPHIDAKRKPLTKAGSPNILVHVVATYDDYQAVLGFLCRHVLGCLLVVHARVGVFAAYNGMIRGYTENLVIRCTSAIRRIIFCHAHLLVHTLNKWVLQYTSWYIRFYTGFLTGGKLLQNIRMAHSVQNMPS